jgi:hypothetical protein
MVEVKRILIKHIFLCKLLILNLFLYLFAVLGIEPWACAC